MIHNGTRMLDTQGKQQFREIIMRQMIWIKTARIEAWACSSCAWMFSPTGPPLGADLDEMKRNFERQRDKEYAFHVCAEHPGPASARSDSKFSKPTVGRTDIMNPGGRRKEMA
jgi:hypothetical protein